MAGEENRVHARIHVSTSIEVRRLDGTERRNATLRDLSKGGARFVVATALAPPGVQVELFLPSLAGPDIRVAAEIVRVTPGPDGDMVQCRFDEVAPEMRQQLLDLIEVLLSTSSGNHRQQARVARRMDIGFADLAELRAILEEIGAGTLSTTVLAPLVLYEELDVTVPDTNGDQLLILHARVVSQRAVPVDPGAPPMYRVGLEMGALRPETRRCLDGLLETVDELVAGEERRQA